MISAIDEAVSGVSSPKDSQYEASNVEAQALNQSAGASQASLHNFIKAACL